MINLILATWLSLPLYPLNPTDADTISTMNIHITAGVNGPSKVLSMGPEITVKYEYMVYHPIILRTSLDYRYGKISSLFLPDGDIHRGILSVEMIYYRGVDKLTAYFGTGFVMAISSFKFKRADDDVLIEEIREGTKISVSNAFGFRFTFGLRINRVYSLEIGITEISPEFVYYNNLGIGRYSEARQKFRFNDFKFSFGYLFPLKL